MFEWVRVKGSEMTEVRRIRKVLSGGEGIQMAKGRRG
jgi:hypothetical protein